MTFTTDTGRLASIPLWLLKSSVSSGAIRLYGVLDAEWAQQQTHETIPTTRGQLADAMGFSKKSISRFIAELEDVGALVVTHHRQGDTWLPNVYTLRRISDHTLGSYLTIPQHGKSLAIDGLERPQSEPQPTAIAKSSTRSVQLNKDASLFDEFYRVYPVKKGKAQALKTWKKLNLEKDAVLRQKVMAGVLRFSQWLARERKESRYLPHPSTWLNGRRWEDVLEVQEPILTNQTRSIVSATEGFLRQVKGGQS